MHETFAVERLLSERDDTLRLAADRAITFLNKAQDRRVPPTHEAIENLDLLDSPLSETPTDASSVISELDEIGSNATLLTISPRFFGFVAGGSLPVTVAAQWLAVAWDQLPNMNVLSPIACKLEDVTETWLVDLLGLPQNTQCSFVTGTTTADITCLLGARNAVLERYRWNQQEKGLEGAPPIKVFVGSEVHTTMLRALRVIGIGNDQIERLPVDSNGAIDSKNIPDFTANPTIICLQAGNVDSGSFDPFDAIIKKAKKAKAWVHIDGAFGLWAAASPKLKYLTKGINEADSWATDAHKWLNVPYDSGLAFFKNQQAIKKVLTLKADYLIQESGDPMDTTLEASRRARGVEVWAAIRSLGRQGVAALIEKSCDLAKYFEVALLEKGYEILNDVRLNQVMVSFGSDHKTRLMINALQEDGTAWFSGTKWHGKEAMRISVTCWSTTKKDIDKSLEAIFKIADKINEI